jgi:AcrR family transcriptional regulator
MKMTGMRLVDKPLLLGVVIGLKTGYILDGRPTNKSGVFMSKGPGSEGKRNQILAAVRKLLAQNGYAATTITQVAKEAGVSRGLLHYYFKNKEEMLAQVIRENVEKGSSLTLRVFEQSATPRDIATQIINKFGELFSEDPYHCNVYFESWAVARQSRLIKSQLTEQYARFRDTLQTGLQTAVTRGVLSPQTDPVNLAGVLASLLDGLALQLMADPELAGDQDFWRAARDGIVKIIE